MPTTFRSYAPDQDLLLAPSLHDWLPADHLAYFISELIDTLDLSAFYAPYAGDGRRKQPYEPRMMLKVLIYAYATGTFSSRRIAAKLEDDVAYRVLAADNFPQHRTICAFRKRHLTDFKALFVTVVQLAGELGLARLGTVAIDGTKVGANASKHKAMSYDRLTQQAETLRAEIDGLCTTARDRDDAEDTRYGAEARGDEVPDELRHKQTRLNRIQQAKARLEAEQQAADEARGRRPDDGRRPPSGRGPSYKRDYGVPEDRAQTSLTDPEARVMPTAHGYQYSYNGQLAVDGDFQLIIANELTPIASDRGQLLPVLDQTQQTLGGRPQRLLADAGYRKEADLAQLEARGIDAYVALGREGRTTATIDGQRHPATHRMQTKLATPDGRETYRQRKHIVEAVNGWIKQVLGFRRFSIRGQQGAAGEWDLVCLATNLRRMRPLMVFE
ncbi:IS1182 family transposase [Salinisphaera sp. RV14]|uniref:IS1182 family transposase n=1 Tax=unclassified Salinisphaera TaxID=2649847 RepID=UPI003F82E2C5